MRYRVGTILALALICSAPTATWADLESYSQDFETLTPAPQPEDPFESSLGDDGWLFFGNVFYPNGDYWFGYGVFPAPNHGQAISAVVTDEGGPDQGLRQLAVFSDYRNDLHGGGAGIETNVFQEQVIGVGDIGTTWRFEFDARRANIGGGTTAVAFFKTLHPTQYWLSRFITIDMTNVPDTWGRYSLSIRIDPDLEGHLLQFGFLNMATYYEDSGIFYDNVNFRGFATICHIPPGNPDNAHTITIALEAVNAHLNHGDTFGACDDGSAASIDSIGNEGNGPGDRFQAEPWSGSESAPGTRGWLNDRRRDRDK